MASLLHPPRLLNLQTGRLALHQPPRAADKLFQRQSTLVALAPDAQTNPTRLRFLVPDHQDVRQLLHGEVANLGAHLLVAVVNLYPQSRILQRRL